MKNSIKEYTHTQLYDLVNRLKLKINKLQIENDELKELLKNVNDISQTVEWFDYSVITKSKN